MEAGPLGELMTEAGDSLVTSPVVDVGHAIAKELAPVSKTFQSAAASAKVRHLNLELSVIVCVTALWIQCLDNTVSESFRC